jgi:hypothetical protein
MIRTFTRSFAPAVLAPVVLAFSILSAACIQKETRSVIYLETDGSVTWSITESDVHSDAGDPKERAGEEADYAREMAASPAPLAALLESWDGRSVSRTILKDTVPFEVHTTARFDRIDTLFERVCASIGQGCVSRMVTAGGRTTWSLELPGETEENGSQDDVALDLLANLKIVIVEGSFVASSGFILGGDRTAKIDEKATDAGHAVLTLTWERARQ